MAINILNEDVFNRISAGEVVERPASVVKELFENSIDAGAKNISIEISNGGLSEIIISDDGCGIESNDVEKAFMPHATSKIKNVEDLDNISSLGFRGEALASIASVSRVEMITKTKDEDFATKISLVGGKKEEKSSIGAFDGTTIIVRNLFFNTPARLKFLKKPKSEEGEITHLVSKLILANPEISVKYVVDGKIIYSTFGNGLKEALYVVYGKEAYDNLVKVEENSGELRIEGFIARPTYCKSNKTYETLFVNGRLVSNYMISSAILDALEGQIMKGKFPLFALNLTLPFEDVDVNVHPSKQEVKFSNPGRIYGFVSNAIFKALEGVSYVQEIKFNNVENLQKVEDKPQTIKDNTGASFKFLFDEKQTEDVLKDKPSQIVKSVFSFNEENIDFFPKTNALEEVEVEARENKIELSKQEELGTEIKDYTIVGTLFDTYIVLEQDDNVLLLDQHAGHERFLFDKIMQEVNNNQIISQNLFLPIKIKINEKEFNFLSENIDKFKNFGFTIALTNNEINVFSVPYLLSGMNIENFFASVLKDTETFVGKPISYINEKFTQLACKSAIKGGDKISESEIEALLNNFKNGDHVLLCPHGRPIVVEISKTELEKLFKRIV